MPEYYVGTLSGTSADGIDAVLVDFAEKKLKLIAAKTYPMPDAVRSEIRALSTPTDNEIERLGRLDITLGRLIAEAVNELLAESGVPASEVIAIGSHGQTLRHRPDADPPFTLQIGDPNSIAVRTGITTIADFRRMDMALGGQGAPLAPIFHDAHFRQEGLDIAILNLGGIANLTLLPGDLTGVVTGFDTGPGNCLMDDWILHIKGLQYDNNGTWAASGSPCPDLVAAWLSDDFFQLPPPKSSGREKFNTRWILETPGISEYAPEDVQASLVELTVSSISNDLEQLFDCCSVLLICGGGAHNPVLMDYLVRRLDGLNINSTAGYGVPPDWVEGCAFAYLARANLTDQKPSLQKITGATHIVPIGIRYRA
jgi:anhydro-N-acetylmuramic acid kinase